MNWIPYLQGDGWLHDLTPCDDQAEAMRIASEAVAELTESRVCIGVRRSDVPAPEPLVRQQVNEAFFGVAEKDIQKRINYAMLAAGKGRK